MAEKCEDCKFVAIERSTPTGYVCRRYPPRLVVYTTGKEINFDCSQPVVQPKAGWCGEFQKRLVLQS